MPVGDGPPLVGRERELAEIAAALARHGGGAAATVLIRGEAGIGKTRLLDDLCERAQARGDLVLRGRGAEFERDIPFGVWIDALDDWAGTLGLERLERLLGERVEELAWMLPGVPAPAGATRPALAEERYRGHRAVRALLDALARQRRVVVALDDLHWADAASVELLSHVLRRPWRTPVLLALAFRTGQIPTGLSAAMEAASRDGDAVELAPAALSAEEADALLGPLAPAARPGAFRESGGNPFYLSELVRVARRAPPGAAAVPDALAGTPPSVAAALAQEIAALEPSARLLAQGAAVSGEPVELDDALAAAGLVDSEVPAALDALLAADLLRSTDVPRRYRFRHPIVRRAVYEGAGESWRLRGHARVAAALEARGAPLGDRAHHLERCAQPGDEAAIGALAQAAHAVIARAPASAARWLQSALRLLPATAAGQARRLELLIPLAVTQAAEGRLESALGSLQEALERLPSELAELHSRLVAACAAIENLLGRHGAAHARLLRELDALGGLSPAAAGVLHVELAVDAIYDSDFAAVAAWAQRAAASAKACEDASLAAVAPALECFAHYSTGAAGPAERCRVDAAARLDALTDDELAGRLEAPYYLGCAEFFCERYDDAAAHLSRGIALARATGQGQYLVPMLALLAVARETRGHVPEGVEIAEAAVDAARLSANAQVLAWALGAQAWTAAMAGDHERAHAACDEAAGLLVGLDPSVLTHAIHTTIGTAWIEVGKVERGLRQLDVGGAPDFALVEVGRRAWLYAYLALADLALGRVGLAQAWVTRGEQTLAGLELPMAESALLRARAALALAREDPRGAAALALRGAERAGEVRARVQAARCRTIAGRALVADGRPEQAAAELERAEAELAACGAARLRDEAARELRRIGHRVAARQRRPLGIAGLDGLSGRERDIVGLVAQGRTNREIGEELFLSARTVEGHLTNVFAKLGVGTRAEVAEVVGRLSRTG